MLKILFSKSLVKTFIILAIFLLPFFALWLYIFAPLALDAATSPDAIAFRVMPNPDHLSPRRWYQENIKLKGSPQGLTVDGYEAVRDGRTVYVNAANIDLNNRYCSKDQSISCSTSDTQCVSAGGACVPKFYSNIYIISYNQQAENETVDIFAQILAHWKFNTNISEPEDNKETVAKTCLYSSECSAGEYCLSLKAKIIRDTKRLGDLADIELVLDNYQKAHSGDYPALSAGSYVAGKSLSVWPSWQATLAKELAVILPVDPVNRLGDCSNPLGYNRTTCWNQALKKFAGIPANSQTYVYTYNGKRSYNLCALMESGYLTTLQGACAGSAVGYKVTCVDDATAWSSKYIPDNVCKGQKIVETSNCGNTRVVFGKKTGGICGCVFTSGKPCTSSATNNCGIPGSGYFDCAGNCPATPPDNGTIVCSGNTDCDDGNDCTANICNNPNTCNSSCSNPAISGTHLLCSNNSCMVANNTSSLCANDSFCGGKSDRDACDCVPASGEDCTSAPNNCGVTSTGKKNCLGACPAIAPDNVVVNCNNNATDQPNCKNTASRPDNSEPNSAGTCCPDETCYKCATGYIWDNISACVVADCEPNDQAQSCGVYNCGSAGDGCGESIGCGACTSPLNCSTTCANPQQTCSLNTMPDERGTCCGDGVKKGSEVCDGTAGLPAPPNNTCSVQVNRVDATNLGIPNYCLDAQGITLSGVKTCKSDCSTIVCAPNTTTGGTTSACDTSGLSLTGINGYACCTLTACTQDGCACCGRGKAVINSPYTKVSAMSVSWETWGSTYNSPTLSPRTWDSSNCTTAPGVRSISCQGASGCGQYNDRAGATINCKTFIKDALGKDTSRTTDNNCPTDSCKLGQDQRLAGNPRNWYVAVNDSMAYYKCWE